jgi:hypothetical protein
MRKAHYEQIIARANRSDWSNRDTIVAECRWHIEQIERQAAEFNAGWRRFKNNSFSVE